MILLLIRILLFSARCPTAVKRGFPEGFNFSRWFAVHYTHRASPLLPSRFCGEYMSLLSSFDVQKCCSTTTTAAAPCCCWAAVCYHGLSDELVLCFENIQTPRENIHRSILYGIYICMYRHDPRLCIMGTE